MIYQMNLQNFKNAAIVFGDITTSLIPKDFFSIESARTLAKTVPVSELCAGVGASALCMAHQIHGFDGLTVNVDQPLPRPWFHDADYLITPLRGVAIGIATADCIPLLLYDSEHEVIAAIHAGWKGMAACIIEKAIQDLQENHGTNPTNLHAWIGPAARSCCYKVSVEVVEACQAPDSAICKNNNTLYLDLIETTRYRLQQAGLNHVDTEAALCTICSPQYNSHRRDNSNLRRQLSIIVLQK
jgi:YfiH family protein